MKIIFITNLIILFCIGGFSIGIILACIIDTIKEKRKI